MGANFFVIVFLKNRVGWFSVCKHAFPPIYKLIILIFSRALQALPVNIDPIPRDVTQDFGLLSLHDVSVFTPNYFIDAGLLFVSDIVIIHMFDYT
jgi:hypothetical protein